MWYIYIKVVDAMIGEVLTTCEKFQWTINNGEKYLKPEERDVGALMLMKKVVEPFLIIILLSSFFLINYTRIKATCAPPPSCILVDCFSQQSKTNKPLRYMWSGVRWVSSAPSYPGTTLSTTSSTP